MKLIEFPSVPGSDYKAWKAINNVFSKKRYDQQRIYRIYDITLYEDKTHERQSLPPQLGQVVPMCKMTE